MCDFVFLRHRNRSVEFVDSEFFKRVRELLKGVSYLISIALLRFEIDLGAFPDGGVVVGEEGNRSDVFDNSDAEHLVEVSFSVVVLCADRKYYFVSDCIFVSLCEGDDAACLIDTEFVALRNDFLYAELKSCHRADKLRNRGGVAFAGFHFCS